MPHIQDHRGDSMLDRVWYRETIAAGFALALACVLSTHAVSAASSPDIVCERYLSQTQRYIEPGSLETIRAACLQRAAESDARAVGYVFGKCLHGGREPEVLTACLSDALGDKDRFAEISTEKPRPAQQLDSGREPVLAQAEQARSEAAAQATGARQAAEAATAPIPPVAQALPAIPPQALTGQLIGERPSLQEITVKSVLDGLLVGNSLDEVSIRGLRPGMAYAEAEEVVRQQWNYVGNGAGRFGPSNPAQFAAANRDGGMLHFDGIDEKLGQIKYTERYKVLLDANRARERLTDFFGKPDKEQGTRIGWMLAWSNYPIRLQVKVVNEASGVVGYQSTVELALWSREYETVLAARKLRCDELRQIPADRISEPEKQELQTDCAL